MRNLMLVVAFDGTGLAGWQRQKGIQTIQGILEDQLAIMTGQLVSLHGAGRTDAGVHALGMTANFLTDNERIPSEGFRRGLNSLLPRAIRILVVEEKEPSFHARKNAVGKTYFYQLCRGGVCVPTDRLYQWQLETDLDLSAMREALTFIVGKHDFSSFEGAGSRDRNFTEGKGAVRTIFRATVNENSGDRSKLTLVVSGDGFLRHMVRNIVGAAVEVGRGRLTPDQFRGIRDKRDRTLSSPTAPAQGLFLQEVYYAKEDLPLL
ncbi:MAG: tRNA pseudouridine(38-40) synthase TruA [Proteobacteria bacterium]|nr:tRNA pseudouridine(38-40) synthase TruA [Pseudomonadota bacterium]MBU1688092.1 tRNA pseudouridine(38-40) synthase TruA [Pseudomonadota bacterium]